MSDALQFKFMPNHTDFYVLTERVFSCRDSLPAGTRVRLSVIWTYKDGSQSAAVEDERGIRIDEVALRKIRPAASLPNQPACRASPGTNVPPGSPPQTSDTAPPQTAMVDPAEARLGTQ